MVSPSLRRQQDTISNRMNDPKWLLDQENPRLIWFHWVKKLAASSDKINKGPQVTIKTIAITAFNPKIAKFDLDDCYMGALTSGDNTQLTWHVNRCGKTNGDLTKVKRAQATNMEISEQTAKLKYDTMRSIPANTCKLKMRHASSSRCASGHNLASPLSHPLHKCIMLDGAQGCENEFSWTAPFFPKVQRIGNNLRQVLESLQLLLMLGAGFGRQHGLTYQSVTRWTAPKVGLLKLKGSFQTRFQY